MSADKFEIRFVKTWREDDIVKLYTAGNWWKDSYIASDISKLIAGSYVFAVAIPKENKEQKAIGMGRVISDGCSDGYIQDLVVLPEYRGRGVGEQILKSLVNHCKKNGIKWIGLIAEPNTENFYVSLGFTNMIGHIPMRFEK